MKLTELAIQLIRLAEMLHGYAACVQSELQRLEVKSYFSNIKGS